VHSGGAAPDGSVMLAVMRSGSCRSSSIAPSGRSAPAQARAAERR
jgi:hypothetical protein